MTSTTAAQAAYLVAALLFILALAGLSKHESARLGNVFGMLGMAVALVATIVLAATDHISGAGAVMLAVAMVIGASVGLQRASRVEMTGMPELIAANDEAYVALAAELGRDPVRRADLRQRILAERHLLYRDQACIDGLARYLEAAVLR